AAGFRINTKNDNVVRLFVGCKQQRTPRGDFKTAGNLAFRGRVLDQRQSAFFWIDGEHCNAVVPAVRGVDELAGRMDLDLGVVVMLGKILGESRDRLQRTQDASSAVITKGRNCGPHFVDYVGKLAVGMKSEVSGTGSGIGLGERWVVRGKRTPGAVKFIHE